MGALDGEIWVCADCRSINNARSKQCYNCRTPRELAAVDPSAIEGTGHGKLREIALPAFHSPRPYAAIASILILVTAALQVLYTLNFTRLGMQVLGGVPATAEQIRFLDVMQLVSLAVAAAALVGWSLWLSRAVTAMPALGLGYPAASGLMAFVENFLPGLNLLRVPAIVRDVAHRIEPGQTRGEALIFAAWIGLLGGFVVPRIGAFWSGLSADSPESLLRSQLPILGVSAGLVLVGAVFLVALIWWVEERIARRREAQLAAIDAAAAGAIPETEGSTKEEASVPSAPAPVAPAPTSVAQAPTTVVQVTAESSPWSWRDTSESPLATSGGAAAAAPGPGWDNEFAPPAWPAAPLPQDAQAAEPAPPPPTEAAPAAESAPVVSTTPIPEREPVSPAPEPVTPAPEPVTPAPEPVTPHEPVTAAAPARDEPTPVAAAEDGVPHLTIRVTNRGMLQAELGGETEPVILEDLTAYGHALASAGGSAEIVLAGNDGMVHLIARRAQRILADTGIDAPIPD